MPMRTPFTPALPTGILFCELATTVSGSSTTTRAGEFSLLTLRRDRLAGTDLDLDTVRPWNHVHALQLVVRGSRAGVSAARLRRDRFGARNHRGLHRRSRSARCRLGCRRNSGRVQSRAAIVGLLLLQRFCRAARVVDGVRVLCPAFVAADPPTIIAIARMPVVSFIAIPTSPPAFPVSSRRLPLKVSNRD